MENKNNPKLSIEYVSIDAIKPYENNAKLHPEEQIEEIVESINTVGFRDPIGIWNGEIVEGHGRYIAAKRIGMETVPVIRLDDMTDEQRRAYMLIHNQTTMNSGWDMESLNVELEGISEIDMSAFGFNLDFGDGESKKVAADDYEPEPPEEPRTKPGDIYQLGEHRLICGDSTDADVIGRLVGGGKG